MTNQIHTMLDKETGTWYNKQDGAKRARRHNDAILAVSVVIHPHSPFGVLG